MSEEKKLLVNVSNSSNLIDFNSPDMRQVNNFLFTPLIPAPSNTRKLLSLPTRDSLENNPFDKMFKQCTLNEIIKNDPFESVFEKAFSKRELECTEEIKSSNESGRQNLNVTDTFISDIKQSVIGIDSSVEESLGILSDSALKSSVSNIFKESSLLHQSPLGKSSEDLLKICTPRNSSLYKTPSPLTIENERYLSNSAELQLRNSIARRVSRCIDQASPKGRSEVIQEFSSIRRSFSNSALQIKHSPYLHLNSSMNANDILQKLRDFKSDIQFGDKCKESFTAVNSFGKSYTNDLSSLKSNSLMSADLDREFKETSRLPSYNISSSHTEFSKFSLADRRSLSARKPTKYELQLGLYEKPTYTTKLTSFQQKLHVAAKEKEIEERKKQILNESLLFEAQQIANTISKVADGSLILSDNESEEEIIENELLTSHPDWDSMDDLESNIPIDIHKKFETKDMFQKIDKIFPNCDKIKLENDKKTITTISNMAVVEEEIIDREHEVVSSTTQDNERKLTRQTSKKQIHTIELLENLTQLLKNQNSDKEKLEDNLISSLAKVLDDNNAEDLDSTASLDDSVDLSEEKIESNCKLNRSKSFNGKSSESDTSLRAEIRTNSLHNITNTETVKESKLEKKSNLIQKISEKLKFKRADNTAESKIKQSAGPLKAVIPLNNMTKDSKINLKKSALRPKILQSTPKADIKNTVKSKPVAQSTPTTTRGITLKAKKMSSVGLSPINSVSIKTKPLSVSFSNSPNVNREPHKRSQTFTFKSNSSSLDVSMNLSDLSEDVFENSKSSKLKSLKNSIRPNKYETYTVSSLSGEFTEPSLNAVSNSKTSRLRLTSVQSASSIGLSNQKRNNIPLVRRKSASELKTVAKLENGDEKNKKNTNLRSRMNTSALRPLNMITKAYRSTSMPSGKENINCT